MAAVFPLIGAVLGVVSVPIVVLGRPWTDTFLVFKYCSVTIPAAAFGLHPFWPILPLWFYNSLNCLFIDNLLEVAFFLELKHSKIMAASVAVHGLCMQAYTSEQKCLRPHKDYKRQIPKLWLWFELLPS